MNSTDNEFDKMYSKPQFILYGSLLEQRGKSELWNFEN